MDYEFADEPLGAYESFGEQEGEDFVFGDEEVQEGDFEIGLDFQTLQQVGQKGPDVVLTGATTAQRIARTPSDVAMFQFQRVIESNVYESIPSQVKDAAVKLAKETPNLPILFQEAFVPAAIFIAAGGKLTATSLNEFAKKIKLSTGAKIDVIRYVRMLKAI